MNNKIKKTLLIVIIAVLALGLAFVVIGLRTGLVSPAASKGENTATESRQPNSSAEPEITPEPEPTPEPVDYTVLRIAELMPSNKSTLADADGQFPDWLEVYNAGTKAIDLEGCVLTCGSSKYALEGTIAPGAYLCVMDDPAGEEKQLSLPKDGAEVLLYSPEGEQIDAVAYPQTLSDVSVVVEEGTLSATDFPSPGYENTPEGCARFQAERTVSESLQINEVLVYNASFNKVGKEYYDLVELRNASSQAIQLSSWYLSDKGSERAKYQLPEMTLGAGETFLVYCTGSEELAAQNAAYAPFALSAEEDTLYLSASDGTLCDYVHLKNIPYCGSIGRLPGQNGFFYFLNPTPGQVNAGTCAPVVAERPVLDGKDGVFDDVDSVTVTLCSSGEIHYTMDGSTPTEASPLYTGPITLSSTAVIRAITVRPGCLNSESLDLSYIINEGLTLPVFSVVMDPAKFVSIYNNPDGRNESPATGSFYDGEDGFTIQCGLKLHGATSRYAQKKKSMKLTFRSRYEGRLEYDLFENGVTEFSSILLRAAQEDVFSTLIRDRLMHQLASEAYPDLSVQDGRYAILFINGDYRGIYSLREAHSAAHFAAHTGQNEEDIIQWQEAWPADSVIGEVYRLTNNNLADPETYARVAEHLDLNSIMEWTIIQAFSGNFDIAPPNSRFYYNTQTQVMSYALVDLDLGMFEDWYWTKALDSGYALSSLSKRLLSNPEYRAEFLRQMGEALSGPLADENVHAEIDALAEQIRPEIERDRARWGGSVFNWEKMINDLHNFINSNGGRAKAMISTLNKYTNITAAEKELYFSEVK